MHEDCKYCADWNDYKGECGTPRWCPAKEQMGYYKDMLNVCDKVVMNDKYYVSESNKGKEFVVKTEPQEVCGTMSVWLEGFKGCYAVDGLTKIN